MYLFRYKKKEKRIRHKSRLCELWIHFLPTCGHIFTFSGEILQRSDHYDTDLRFTEAHDISVSYFYFFKFLY